MGRIQDDILEIYNTLQEFSKETLEGTVKKPIEVDFADDSGCLVFRQSGKIAYLPLLNYYCGNLRNIRKTYLLPEDYDILMRSMQVLISNNILVEDRLCVSPEIYGIDFYKTTVTTASFREGPQLVGSLRFVSGNSWIFRMITKYKYRSIL